MTHGEQVSILWHKLNQLSVLINFAHRTFEWTSEAKGKAAVHCVFIGLSSIHGTKKQLFDYVEIQGEPSSHQINSIPPYLTDAPHILIEKHLKPI